jgi:hypothetical protein
VRPGIALTYAVFGTSGKAVCPLRISEYRCSNNLQ